jgi:hypothetical protein
MHSERRALRLCNVDIALAFLIRDPQEALAARRSLQLRAEWRAHDLRNRKTLRAG